MEKYIIHILVFVSVNVVDLLLFYFVLSLSLKWVSQIQHIVGHFLLVVFCPFAYNVIIDMVECKSTILLLFSIYRSCLYSLSFLLSLGLSIFL